MRTVKNQFPDFDGKEWDVYPFTPEPWGDDVCPRYVWRGSEHSRGTELANCELTFWTQYVDPARRETGGKQFILNIMAEESSCGLPIHYFEGETEEELRAAINDWYVATFGQRIDSEGRVPLGILMHYVGTLLWTLAHRPGSGVTAFSLPGL